MLLNLHLAMPIAHCILSSNDQGQQEKADNSCLWYFIFTSAKYGQA